MLLWGSRYVRPQRGSNNHVKRGPFGLVALPSSACNRHLGAHSISSLIPYERDNTVAVRDATVLSLIRPTSWLAQSDLTKIRSYDTIIISLKHCLVLEAMVRLRL